MQSIASPYSTIVSGEYRVESKFIIDGDDYSLDDIFSAKIDGTLFDELTIGNAATRTLTIVLKGTPEISRGATIEYKQKAYNATQSSDWVPKGTFYISKREVDQIAQRTTITAYDAMNRADVVFFETGVWSSSTALVIAGKIATHIGVLLSGGTTTMMTNDPVDIDFIPAIGTDGTTEREMLQYIGILYGGNWTITDANELTLIPLSGTGDTTTIGSDAQKCTNQAELPEIDRVVLTNGESVFKAPANNYDSLTGTVISVECPYANAENAARVLSIISGFEYQPFKATRAYLEPAAGLGDGISIYEISSIIVKQSMTISNTSPSDLSADYSKQEVDDEYEYKTPVERQLAREEQNRKTSITILDGRIEANADTIEAVTERLDGQSAYIRWDGITATLSIGESSAPTEAQIKPDGFSVTQDGEAIFEVKGRKATARHFEAEETVTIGRYQWVDEDSDGFSLMYVGG